MGKEKSSKVIKPPLERIASGKVFRPARAFIYKGWFDGILVAIGIWLFGVVCAFGIGWIVVVAEGILVEEFWGAVAYWWGPANFWYWLITAIWLTPAVIIWPFYVRRIEYSVIAESGKTMPEIYVRKGIITITEKHVPFRTITNISSRAGPIDRLFGIGSVWIQTAGYSGGAQAGAKPEEKLEGIHIFEAVRDFVLRELRRFRDPYVTGTEVVSPRPEAAVTEGTSSQEEILGVLREIRDLLRRERE
ncbi:MAG: PH domain-containing protein [Candidatus Thorarchaeota archaeon]|nr:MAG: PH domain-containing protein [Candidatus Thorarchaeota archaeon]